MFIHRIAAFMIALGFVSTAGATTYTLDFDDSSENCCFDYEDPPGTDYLSSHGITFTTSFEVLDESGGFGVSGYSSPNFLAWNTFTTGSTVDLEFTDSLTRFTVGAASSEGGTVTVTAYDASASLVSSISLTLSSSMGSLEVNGDAIVYIVISVDSSAWGVLDDLEWDVVIDDDGDGYDVDEDCDDTDSAVYPGATETCDGVDNDCDGTTDEDDASDTSTWYLDADGDGYGDASTTDIACDAPSGYVSDSSDCDDWDSTTSPAATEYCDGHDDDCDGDIDEDDAEDASTWYADADGDGFGDWWTTDVSCDAPTGYVSNDMDCDDADADTWPGATEYCDGHDDDCDGLTDEYGAVDAPTWYADTDGDGYGDADSTYDACDEPSGYVSDATDCDDTDSTVHVDAEEIWYDGVDQNCDGWSDYDQDGDGFDHIDYGGDDCDDEDETVHVEAKEIWYDGVDQDCNFLSDYDADEDGQDSESYGGEDCDDADPDTYTGASDEPYDGVVTDCDNADDYDADGDGSVSQDYEGDDCDDANSDVHPDADEVWYDGIDQDCDGNDDDQDEDGFGVEEDCDDEDADSYPDNGWLDSDCNAIETDTGDSGDSGLDDDEIGKDGGCGSSVTGGEPLGLWSTLLAGLLFLRRREEQK